MTVNMHAFINRISLNRVNCSKCLGVEIDEFLTWDIHITSEEEEQPLPCPIRLEVESSNIQEKKRQGKKKQKTTLIPISLSLNYYQSYQC